MLRTVRSYREAMREFAAMRNLDVWYARLDVDTLLAELAKVASAKAMKEARKDVKKAGKKNSLRAFDRLVRVVDGEPRFISDPPLLVPARELVSEDQAQELEERMLELLGRYRESLKGDRRHLFDGYRFVEMARKVVGVGSVGTRAWVVLMMGRDGQDPLFLQAKEAEASVLEPYVGESEFGNHGERVVEGQWLTQASSDILLGWLPAPGLRRRRTRLLRTPALGRQAIGRNRDPAAGGTGDLRTGLRLDACPSPRAVRRPDRDRVLPRQGQDLRPGDRRVLRALCGPERARLRDARGRGQDGSHRG